MYDTLCNNSRGVCLISLTQTTPVKRCKSEEWISKIWAQKLYWRVLGTVASSFFECPDAISTLKSHSKFI